MTLGAERRDQSIFKDLKPGEIDWGKNKEEVTSLLEKYKERIPREVWITSIDRIDRAFREIIEPSEQATSAFFVHTRRHKGERSDVKSDVFRQLDDSTRCIPLLDPQYRIPEEDVERVWNSLPPFKVGEVNGVLNGKEIKCAIISVPITPKGLEDCDGVGKRISYARPRIDEAAKLAKKMGAKVMGLGETLASLTKHGEILQSQLPDTKITTGHAFTTYFMNEWTKFAVERLGIRLEDSQVTIIGANGSIGSAMTKMLVEQGVGRLNLHDRESMINALNKEALGIIAVHPNLGGKIRITGGDSRLKEACEGSRIVLVAASAKEPFILGEHLDSDTIVINDSQPPSITREEASKANSETIWVVGELPEGLTDTFNAGLVDRGEWTCLLEALALGASSRKFETVGAVTSERVRIAGEIAKELKMGLTFPQSWGVSNLQ